MDISRQFQKFHHLIPTNELMKKNKLKKCGRTYGNSSHNLQLILIRNLIVKYIVKIESEYDMILDYINSNGFDIRYNDIIFDDENNIMISL
jgi:hypothetical protein